jgi:hypothetical protein
LIRSAKTRRTLAWLGLFAIALIAIVPTFSQLLARPGVALAAAPRNGLGDDHAATSGLHPEHHAGADRGTHASPHGDTLTTPPGAPCLHDHGGKPDDCWKKCGYCDFLTQTPSLGGFEYIAIFAAGYPPLPAARALTQRAHVLDVRAAQPRGPPVFL